MVKNRGKSKKTTAFVRRNAHSFFTFLSLSICIFRVCAFWALFIHDLSKWTESLFSFIFSFFFSSAFFGSSEDEPSKRLCICSLDPCFRNSSLYSVYVCMYVILKDKRRKNRCKTFSKYEIKHRTQTGKIPWWPSKWETKHLARLKILLLPLLLMNEIHKLLC